MSKDKGKGKEFTGGPVGRGVRKQTEKGEPIEWKMDREDKTEGKAQRHDPNTAAHRRVRGEGRDGNKK